MHILGLKTVVKNLKIRRWLGLLPNIRCRILVVGPCWINLPLSLCFSLWWIYKLSMCRDRKTFQFYCQANYFNVSKLAHQKLTWKFLSSMFLVQKIIPDIYRFLTFKIQLFIVYTMTILRPFYIFDIFFYNDDIVKWMIIVCLPILLRLQKPIFDYILVNVWLKKTKLPNCKLRIQDLDTILRTWSYVLVYNM